MSENGDAENGETTGKGNDDGIVWGETRESHPDEGPGKRGATHGVEPVGQRTTAPMSDFSTRQAGMGFLTLLVGLVVVFGLAFVFV